MDEVDKNEAEDTEAKFIMARLRGDFLATRFPALWHKQEESRRNGEGQASSLKERIKQIMERNKNKHEQG